MRGSPPDEPERRPGEDQVEVTLSRGFWAGKFEVTQGEWKRVAGVFNGKYTAGEGEDFPIYDITFVEAEDFCRKLTESARKLGEGELPSGWEFRLPTDAQWEYFCRAGTTTATHFGNSFEHAGELPGQALTTAGEGAVAQATAPVGTPGQSVGPARRARQRVRVVSRLGPRQIPGRDRPRPLPGGRDGPEEPDGRHLARPSRRLLRRRRVAVPLGVPGSVRTAPPSRSHRFPGGFAQNVTA